MMDEAERQSLRTTLAHVFQDATDAKSLTTALGELGWHEACAEDPSVAVPLFFEEQGSALSTSRFLDDLLAAQLGTADANCVAVALPAAGRLVVRGLTDDVAQVVLPPTGCDDATGPTSIARDELVIQPVSGIDPSAELALVEPPGPSTSTPVAGSWPAALGLARRSLAAELVGIGRAALALGVAHVSSRTQFGRPIGSFQAVRHRLAECYAELASAEVLVAEAFSSLDDEDAAVAKAVAGRAADQTVRGVIQVSGAIGLTWEHRVHRYVRRAAVLDTLAGTVADLELEIGTRYAGALTS